MAKDYVKILSPINQKDLKKYGNMKNIPELQHKISGLANRTLSIVIVKKAMSEHRRFSLLYLLWFKDFPCVHAENTAKHLFS